MWAGLPLQIRTSGPRHACRRFRPAFASDDLVSPTVIGVAPVAVLGGRGRFERQGSPPLPV